MGKKGFIMILVVGVIAALMIVAWAVVGIGCGEILQTSNHNDYFRAYYLSRGAAERMYAKLKDLEDRVATATWPTSIANTNLSVNGSAYGNYSVTADLVSTETGVIMAVPSATVNGHTTRVTVKYGIKDSSYINGIPLGSMGPMNLLGQRWWFLTSWVYADGPIQSASTINPANNTNNRYVRYTGDVNQNVSGLVPPTFWLGTPLDTNNDGSVLVDQNGDGRITRAEAEAQEITNPGAMAVFDSDNRYAPADSRDLDGNGTAERDEINEKDAYFNYYTSYLNNPANNRTGQSLGINPGGANYYSSDTTFGPWNVPAGTSIVFINGDANIIFNAQKWWGSSSDLVVVSMEDITIVQPVNGSDDRLTLISAGDIVTGGINLGELADIDGNIEMCASDDFTAVLGGSTNGSIWVGGDTSIQTGLPSFLFNRDLNRGTDNWANPANRPLGLPPGTPLIAMPFGLKAEQLGLPANNYKPRWQHR